MENVIVIGLGAMGSSTALHLAERGCRVLGFDQFTPPHTLGSSHGQTRIIRQSYWEDPRYVPLLLRAYELWRKLEADSGEKLLHLTGGLMIGRADGDLVGRSTISARKFDLPHRILSNEEIRRHYPVFKIKNDFVALWEENAGFLVPEACIRAQLSEARRAGAELHLNEQVVEWKALPGEGVSARTERGIYHADRLVITAGPWTPQVFRDLRLPLQVTRQVIYWFEPLASRELFRQNRLPIFLVEAEGDGRMFYGVPSTAPNFEGVKVGLHGSEDFCSPQTIDREIHPEEVGALRERLANTLPLLNGRLLHAETCMYTMTPDEHFVIGQHPQFRQVTLAAGFSGHGFKFASVMGEVLSDIATDRAPDFDLDLFSIQRYSVA